MAYCKQCGAEIDNNSKFCISCGTAIEEDAAAVQTTETSQNPNPETTDSTGSLKKLLAYTDTTGNYDADDVSTNRYLSAMSYLHILVLVPLMAMKDSPFAQYHAKVGLNLLLMHLAVETAETIMYSLVGWIPVIGWVVSFAFGLLNLALWCVNIFGIVSAVKGRARELSVLDPVKPLK